MYPSPPNMWGIPGMNSPQAMTPSQAPIPEPPNWFDHYNQNYAQLNPPNHVYDALREKFFSDHLAPWAMEKGEAVGPLHTQFMKQTEREGTSENPRLALVGKSALAGLLAPLKIAGGSLETTALEAEKAQDAATLEAARNGINPAWYKMLGEAGGQLPYWAAGMGVAGAVGASFELGEAAHSALRVATGALIQGSYDAAKAPDGQRVTQGFQGALEGTAMMGAFEMAGPLWKFLKTGGLPESTAKALEAQAHGTASPSQVDAASQAVTADPTLPDKITEWTTAQGKGAKSAGIPNDTTTGPPDGKITLNIIGADGKPYQDLPAAGVPMDNLVAHLKAGGGIEAVKGDPAEIQGFLKKLETTYGEAFKIDGQANDTIMFGPRQANPEAYGEWWKKQVPTHAMEETEYGKMWEGMDTTRQEAEGSHLLGQPVSFGAGEEPIPGTRGKIKFRSFDLSDVPKSERPHEYVDEDGNPKPAYVGRAESGDYRDRGTPLYTRVMGNDPEMGAAGATSGTLPGEQPIIEFGPGFDKSKYKETYHHEMIHAHMNYLDMHKVLADAAGMDMPRQIFNGGIPEEFARNYAEFEWPEEAFAYTSQAVRTGNQELLQRFGDADTDKAHVLEWHNETANALREHAATLPDSLHKRTLERRLNYTVAKASQQLSDLRRPFSQTHSLSYEPGSGLHYADDLKTGTRTWAPSQGDLVDALSDNLEPLATPELVDTSDLPPIKRFAVDLSGHTTGRAPIHTDPPDPGGGGSGPNLGPLALSNLFRPFYDWVGSVAGKMDRPDLLRAFEDIRDAQNTKFNTARPFTQVLDETLHKYKPERQADFYKYYEASTPEDKVRVAQAANLSTQELAHLKQFEATFDGLKGFQEYVRETIPEMRAQGWDAEKRFPQHLDSVEDNSAMVGRLMRRGQLDPRDENLLRVASTYLNGQTFHDTVEPFVKAAEKIVDEQGHDGDYTFDILRPALRRQIQYYRGVPDWSQKVVMSAVDSAVQLINKGIAGVNSHLPDGMQLPSMQAGPRDILGKFILFNYAGALALRPAVPIRDTLSLFMTSYPVLGEEYLWKGMRKAFQTVHEGLEGDSYSIARENGWLMNKTNLPEMIAGGGANQTGKLSELTEKAMRVMTLSENSKRLAAGWGAQAKIEDALTTFAEHGDKQRFLRESGLWFLSPGRRQLRLQEAAALTGDMAGAKSWTLKATKDMVDAMNWDFTAGAAPGIYKYQLGRLFGQYGQWPMNYIEYARRFMTNGGLEHRAEAIKGLTRLAIAHGAILGAAHGVGIDAMQWVFTQPMAYGGSPIFQAVVNIPNTMDFQTYQGAQARREVIRPIFPGLIPGSNEIQHVWRSVAEGKSDTWIRILGFMPTKEAGK